MPRIRNNRGAASSYVKHICLVRFQFAVENIAPFIVLDEDLTFPELLFREEFPLTLREVADDKKLMPVEFSRIHIEIRVFGEACPLFVPLVEEGWTKDEITLAVAKRYLSGILSENIDTLIMGCTHYPLLRTLLREYLGDGITLVNPAYETAGTLKNLLAGANLGREVLDGVLCLRDFCPEQ